MSEEDINKEKPNVVTLTGETFKAETEEKEVDLDIVAHLEFLLEEAEKGEIEELCYTARMDIDGHAGYYTRNVGPMMMGTFGTLMDNAMTYREDFKIAKAIMDGEIDIGE